jgi:hypothetical protein
MLCYGMACYGMLRISPPSTRMLCYVMLWHGMLRISPPSTRTVVPTPRAQVCPHAGGVGLCEYVRHLSMIDYVCFSASLEGRVCEVRVAAVVNTRHHLRAPPSLIWS